MLHLTTEIGKPGKNERERRHFPSLDSLETRPVYKPRGRRYIPHGYGIYDEWRPHPQNVQPECTDAGPDWKSRLKYIPHPEDPKYPAAEIFENNWKAMRPFPSRMYQILSDTYMNTSNEWLLDPGLSSKGMRCRFNGEHMATRTSADEITHTMLYGKGRTINYIDKRNGLDENSPGDKAYKVPEYSPSFHKLGSSLPVVEFGYPPEEEPFRVKARREEREIEKKHVKALDDWRPATPLKPEKVDDKK